MLVTNLGILCEPLEVFTNTSENGHFAFVEKRHLSPNGEQGVCFSGLVLVGGLWPTGKR